MKDVKIKRLYSENRFVQEFELRIGQDIINFHYGPLLGYQFDNNETDDYIKNICFKNKIKYVKFENYLRYKLRALQKERNDLLLKEWQKKSLEVSKSYTGDIIENESMFKIGGIFNE